MELLSLSLALQVLKGHADKAPQITEEFGRRMAHCCLASLAEFLQRYCPGRSWARGTREAPGCCSICSQALC